MYCDSDQLSRLERAGVVGGLGGAGGGGGLRGSRFWRPLGAPFFLPLRGFLGVFGAAAAAGLRFQAAALFR